MEKAEQKFALARETRPMCALSTSWGVSTMGRCDGDVFAERGTRRAEGTIFLCYLAFIRSRAYQLRDLFQRLGVSIATGNYDVGWTRFSRLIFISLHPPLMIDPPMAVPGTTIVGR